MHSSWLRSIPRELVLGVEDALNAGAARAHTAAKGMDEGHLPHVVGQLRHFNMNEAFYRALAVAEATPTAIQGNGLVTGRTGVFTLARFNIPEGFWINGRRSQTRRQTAFANKAIEPLVQPELFDLLMKRRWGVSVGAILMRLRALELLDDEGGQALFKRPSARWGAKSEPGDGDRAPERPRLLRRTIDLLVDENVMPPEAIPRHLGLASHDIEMLAGLPEGYIQGRGNVVQLARIRQSADAPASSASAPSTVLPFRHPRRS